MFSFLENEIFDNYTLIAPSLHLRAIVLFSQTVRHCSKFSKRDWNLESLLRSVLNIYYCFPTNLHDTVSSEHDSIIPVHCCGCSFVSGVKYLPYESIQKLDVIETSSNLVFVLSRENVTTVLYNLLFVHCTEKRLSLIWHQRQEIFKESIFCMSI